MRLMEEKALAIDNIEDLLVMVGDDFRARMGLMGFEYSGVGVWYRNSEGSTTVMIPDDNDDMWFIRTGGIGTANSVRLPNEHAVLEYLYDVFYNQGTTKPETK